MAKATVPNQGYDPPITRPNCKITAVYTECWLIGDYDDRLVIPLDERNLFSDPALTLALDSGDGH